MYFPYYVCPQCQKPCVEDEFVSQFTDDVITHCPFCNTRFGIVDNTCLPDPSRDIVIPREEDREFLQDIPKSALNDTWYHTTVVSNLDTSDTQRITHIGRRETCQDYADHFRQFTPGTVWLYEVRVSPTAKISPERAFDINSWDYRESKAIKEGKWDGFGYINRWESPGTASLLVRSSLLEVISVSTL